MFTTSRAKPRPPNLPELPPEIWLDIFRYATWTPLNLEPGMVLDFSPTNARERRQLLKQSLVTKRYLVRVCRRWRSMAAPYLYECIIVGRGRGLRTIHDALKASHVSYLRSFISGEEDRPFGWWTKRLDFSMRDVDRSTFDADVYLNLMSEIVEYLPNLVVLTFCVTALPFYALSLPASFLHALIRTSGTSLQAVYWKNTALLPSVQDSTVFIREARSLRAISRPDVEISEEHEIVDLQEQLSSLSLETLFISYCRNSALGIDKANLPFLRHLVLCASALAIPRWKAFLEQHGLKLRILQLHVSTRQQIVDAFSLIPLFCPRLIRCEISLSSWELFGFEPIIIPSNIRTVGVQSTMKESSARHYRAFFNGIDRRECDTLIAIQLLDQGNVQDLCQRHPSILEVGLGIFKQKGLHLQDHEGRAIQ